MLFNSITFLLFFPTVFLVDLALQRKASWRKLFLLVASYLFYANWDWRFLGLIWASTAVDWFVGNALAAESQDKRRKLLLTISLVVNLGMLATFKYLGFFLESTNALLEGIGLEAHLPVLRLMLPVGISFYTFQTLSYTIDIYRRQLEPARTFLDFALFVAFFPQLVAGPIVRAADFIPQLYRNPRSNRRDISLGLYEIAVGLFKKVVIADIIGNQLASPFYNNPEQFGAWGAVLGIYGFCFQVYGDFAGYSQIAIGCARILGFELPQNFRWPFMSRNNIELWSRWHISLSSWLRDYLYIPLGGSRGGRWFIYRNILLTNLLAGLWHGAGWNFVFWGGLNGIMISGAHARNAKRKKLGIGQPDAWWQKAQQRFITFHCFALSLLIFRTYSWDHFTGVLAALTRGSGLEAMASPIPSRAVAALLLAILLHIVGERAHPPLQRAWHRVGPEMQGAFLILLFGLFSHLATERTPFFYFQF